MKTIFCRTKNQHQHFPQILALKFLGLDHHHHPDDSSLSASELAIGSS